MTVIDNGSGPGGSPFTGLDSAVTAEVHERARLILAQGPVPDEGTFAIAYEQAAREAINWVNADRISAGKPPISAEGHAALKQRVIGSLAGLGAFAPLLADESIEEITATGCDNVVVIRSDGEREKAAPVADSDEELIAAVQVLAAGAGLSDTERRFDRASPALNLQLPDGSRLHALRDVVDRPRVTIRRFRMVAATMEQLQALGMFSPDIADLLAAAVAARFNIIIAGPMASGKTTLLSALAGLLPPDESLGTIEDNYELGLHTDPRHEVVVAMQVREPNIEGVGGISASDLFRESLRMRLDRIIVGEVRGPEVAVMLDAMSNGSDGSLSTVHTSTSAGAFMKMKTYARKPPAGYEPEATAELIGGSLDLVVQLAKSRTRRWISSIREVCGSEGAMVVSNELYAPTGPDRAAQFSTPLTAARAERLAEHGWQPPNHMGTW